MTYNRIKSEIIKTDKSLLPANFVAAAVHVNENGEADHSGIVICQGQDCKLFHFNGKDVKLVNSGEAEWPNRNWYYHKVISKISEHEIKAFTGFCRNISAKATPRYGFFYDGLGFYDPSGTFMPDSSLKGEFMTCVGFCLNVIHSFIAEGLFLDSTTWPVSEVTEQDKFEDFIEMLRKKNIPFDTAIVKLGFKRITPSEYLSCAFLEELPITYELLEPINEHVEYALSDLAHN